jgi:agmatine deiminase
MMPAEWSAHRATWMAWPHNVTDWPGKFAPIPWVYGEIVRKLAAHETVSLLVDGPRRREEARRILARVGASLERIEFHRLVTDRGWLRDSGPIFVRRDGEIQAGCWRFNAWAKYDDWKKDAKVARAIARIRGVAAIEHPYVLEGGAIDVDGEGTVLATEECLLSDVQARNPALSREALEAVLGAGLGVTQVIWLGRGIAGDDTHGHIDDLARFVAPGKVVLCVEDDPADENYAALAENRERLEGARDARGRRLEIIPLPMPAPLYLDGRRLPASYANFYIANGIVIVPTFNDPADREALATLAACFPGREVAGIHCVDLVWGLGTLHCMTQQEPAP